MRNISEAKAELSALIAAVQRGEEVIIDKAGKPVAKFIAYIGARAARKHRALRGKIRIAAYFDELPPDIAEAFEMR